MGKPRLARMRARRNIVNTWDNHKFVYSPLSVIFDGQSTQAWTCTPRRVLPVRRWRVGKIAAKSKSRRKARAGEKKVAEEKKKKNAKAEEEEYTCKPVL